MLASNAVTQSRIDRSSYVHAHARSAATFSLSRKKLLVVAPVPVPAFPRLAMARSSSLLAFLVLALGCSALLCFVGTTPAPASKSLRAPAVQMEARGGADGALGDMTPDTYIIGITVFGIASLFANISGFFNP